jgi:hypothetical protein
MIKEYVNATDNVYTIDEVNAMEKYILNVNLSIILDIEMGDNSIDYKYLA